jgi:hypothetical protein
VAILQHALTLVRQLPEAERAVTETEMLAQLAAMYLVSFDRRTLETYEALAAQAAPSCRRRLLRKSLGTLSA